MQWRDFDIDILKLSNTAHQFDFDVDRSFFSLFAHSLVTEGTAKVYLTLDKSERLINADFHITGSIELVCDRSLDPFDYPIDLEESVLYKYGDDPSMTTDEIIIISPDAQKINVAQLIYDYISLAIPMKKIHPDLDEEDGDKVIYQSEGELNDEELGDPRWEVLKKLKNNNKS